MSITKEMIQKHYENCEKKKADIPGVWQNEPNRVEFKHAGLDCLMSRVIDSGHWCGYVGLSKSHPYFGKGYNEIDDINVHGGLTYADRCAHMVCHLTDNEKDERWWLGMDFAHSGDLCPVTKNLLQKCNIQLLFRGIPQHKEHYWTVDEVRTEVESLAEQLAAIK